MDSHSHRVHRWKMSLFILFLHADSLDDPAFPLRSADGLAWKVLIPLALVNLVRVMIVQEFELSPWLLLPVSIGLLIGVAALRLRADSRSGAVAGSMPAAH